MAGAPDFDGRHDPPPGAAVLRPTSAHLLVCTGPNCGARGAGTVLREAWTALEAEQLAYYCAGGSVRLTATACLGCCDHGPTIAAYLTDDAGTGASQRFYVRMTSVDVVALARAANDAHRARTKGSSGDAQG